MDQPSVLPAFSSSSGPSQEAGKRIFLENQDQLGWLESCVSVCLEEQRKYKKKNKTQKDRVISHREAGRAFSGEIGSLGRSAELSKARTEEVDPGLLVWIGRIREAKDVFISYHWFRSSNWIKKNKWYLTGLPARCPQEACLGNWQRLLWRIQVKNPQCERLNELPMTGRVLPSVYKEFGQTQDGKSR